MAGFLLRQSARLLREGVYSVHVAVVIVGYRNVADVAACIAALERSTYSQFEVVVCENGGAEAHEALVRALPQQLADGQKIQVIAAPHNLGYGGGVNLGLAATPMADAWWVLNPDTEAEPGAMAANVARLSQGDCEAVGGTIYLSTGKVQSYGGEWQAWLARAVSVGYGHRIDDPVDVAGIEAQQSYLNGASMFVGRRFLEVAGPMREDYFLYCEEVEWFLRAKARGLRLGFAQDARVLHYAGTTTGSYDDFRSRPRMPVYLGERNKLLVTWDCFPLRLPVVALMALALIFVRFGRMHAWAQIGYAVTGWAAGLAGRRGVPAWASTG